MRSHTGFTLVEILVVMVIAASIFAFALPTYKKSQDHNRYLAAAGVLTDLGSAVLTLRADIAMSGDNVVFPEDAFCLSASYQTGDPYSSKYADISSLNTTAFPYALFTHGYLQPIPYDDATSYKGYVFCVCPQQYSTETESVGCDDRNVVAFMTMPGGSVSAYPGARFFKDGTIVQLKESLYD